MEPTKDLKIPTEKTDKKIHQLFNDLEYRFVIIFNVIKC